MKTYRLLLGLASFFSVLVFATQGHAQTQQPVASQTMSNQLNKEQIKR